MARKSQTRHIKSSGIAKYHTPKMQYFRSFPTFTCFLAIFKHILPTAPLFLNHILFANDHNLFAKNHNWLAKNHNLLAKGNNWFAKNHITYAGNHHLFATKYTRLSALHRSFAKNNTTLQYSCF